MNYPNLISKHFFLKEFDSKELPFTVDVDLCINEKNIMNICYSILGDMTSIDIPAQESEIKRVIGLWESTCFEIFLKAPSSTNYFELNFSPEGHWNCFYFDKPGDYIKPYPLQGHPTTCVEIDLKDKGYYKINIQFDIDQILKTFGDKTQVDIGLTTVVLFKNNHTYWALEHFGDSPNFHDFKTFMPWNLKKITSH